MLMSNDQRRLIGVRFATEFNLDYEKVKGAIKTAPDFAFGLELNEWLTQRMGNLRR